MRTVPLVAEVVKHVISREGLMFCTVAQSLTYVLPSERTIVWVTGAIGLAGKIKMFPELEFTSISVGEEERQMRPAEHSVDDAHVES
jgi:hypothetical protein